MERNTKGQIIGGNFDKVLMRQKKGHELEIGELLICQNSSHKILFQVVDLMHSSQVSQSNIEYISGMKLEENTDFELMDENLRYYTIAELKAILSIEKSQTRSNKKLAEFFSKIKEVQKEDIDFLTMPKNPLYIGKLRSGSKVIDADLFLDGKDVLSHHILVAATTGRGKSNLTSCMLWNLLDHDYAGILVLDPHDEYFGRNKKGLKDHPKGKVVYYTPFNVPTGASTLKINIRRIRPEHFSGAQSFTDAQNDALYTYFKKFRQDWIEKILVGEEILVNGRALIHEVTLNVLRRKLMSLLSISLQNNELVSKGIFDLNAGETTISDICNNLEQAKIVIIDTSNFSGNLEILIGSMISSEIFARYRKHKRDGTLEEKPVISIVLEEAPRVLGKEILERGSNIFSSIAKEGRKFKIGLFAITQLPSLIPKDILANMNTKIILGIEMSSERQAIIDSAAQDLSSDNRNIASLDKGEALITSNFTRFASPVKIPYFPDMIKRISDTTRKDFTGINFQ
ncbi:ATP-binding protein [Candidatus Woesearchaeota archaeon]|nr:ATP-binding protein [Candidatus Woesearchaeota archaeon]